MRIAVQTDSGLLSAFIHEFDQYGNQNAPYWIVGPEEGGVSTIEEFENRLNAWDALGREPVVDIVKFHNLIGEGRWFSEQAPTQATWRPIIYLLLALKGMKPNIENVRQYQKNSLGRITGETWVTELLPLPAKNEGTWIYDRLSEISGLHFLSGRKLYKEYCAPHKIKRLKNAVDKYAPNVVILYGKNDGYWSQIAGGKFDSTLSSGAQYRVHKNTVFVNTVHPNHRGTKNEYWISNGLELRRLIS